MIDSGDVDERLSFWPSVSDLFLTLFIVSFAILAAVFYVLIPRNSPSDESNLILSSDGVELESIRAPTNRMREAIGADPLSENSRARALVSGLGETADDVVEALGDKKSEFERIRDLERQLEESREKLSQAEELREIMAELEAKLKEHNLDIEDPDQVEEVISKLKDTLSEVNEELMAANRALNDKPPIIKIADAANTYFFGSGSATVSDNFLEALSGAEFSVLADEILKRNKGARRQVDTLEIIGHTDGQPITRRGNLDRELPRFLAGKQGDLGNLTPGSNNDLGLLRALSIREAWHVFVSQHPERESLEEIDVRCYSAGQTVPESGILDDPDTYLAAEESFRRIEVRLTKLSDDQSQGGGNLE